MPDKWVSMFNCEKDESGNIIGGEIFAHSKERKEVFQKNIEAEMRTNFVDYTRKVTPFLGFCKWTITDVKTGN